jgi:hypothetical protein
VRAEIDLHDVALLQHGLSKRENRWYHSGRWKDLEI